MRYLLVLLILSGCASASNKFSSGWYTKEVRYWVQENYDIPERHQLVLQVHFPVPREMSKRSHQTCPALYSGNDWFIYQREPWLIKIGKIKPGTWTNWNTIKGYICRRDYRKEVYVIWWICHEKYGCKENE